MGSKIKSFLNMNGEMKWLIIEGFFFLGWARILKAMPFSKVVAALGLQSNETSYTFSTEEEVKLKRISRALHIASKYTWWESQCLVMGLAAMKMLERRDIESTLYFGTAKDGNGRMIAHAWLRSGRIYLTGAAEIPNFTMVRLFGKSIPHRRLKRSTQHG